ncbi:MAG: AAA family ATPase [bacterium]|nr:AAA family ATPase [bacterium]
MKIADKKYKIQDPWWTYLPSSYWNQVNRGSVNELAHMPLLENALLKSGEPITQGGIEGNLINYNDFFNECKQLNGTIVIQGLDPDDNLSSATMAFEQGFASFAIGSNNWASFYYSIADIKLATKINKLCKKYFTPRALSRNIYVITYSNGRCQLTDIGKAALPLERNNYCEKVLLEYDFITNDLKSSAPSGRITIIEGVPGSGKTFLVRGLLNDAPSCTCVIVPASMLSELAGPNLISVLLDAKKCGGSEYPILLIIEDGDMAIIKRDAGNMNTITSLLNFGDGMLGGLMDLRIVITTNAIRLDIDDAIKRPGRLSGTISVNNLTIIHANEILSRLLNKQIVVYEDRDKPTLADVYKKARQLGWVSNITTGYSSPNLVNY